MHVLPAKAPKVSPVHPYSSTGGIRHPQHIDCSSGQGKKDQRANGEANEEATYQHALSPMLHRHSLPAHGPDQLPLSSGHPGNNAALVTRPPLT
ncbi:unnamed protein product [Lota lota]